MSLRAADEGWTSWRNLVAVVTGVACAASIVSQPAIVDGMIELLRYEPSSASLVASGELTGAALGTLGIAMVRNLRWRQTAGLSLLAVVLLDALSAIPGSWQWLMLVRTLAGVAEGAGLGVMTAALAASGNSDRWFAVFVTGNLTLGSVAIALLYRLREVAGMPGMYGFLGILAVTGLLLLPWFPTRAASPAGTPAAMSAASRRGSDGATKLGFLAIVLVFVGLGSTWVLIGQVGAWCGLSPVEVGNRLAAATAVGAGGALLLALVGTRFGRVGPLLSAVGMLAASCALMVLAPTPLVFGVAVCVYMLGWTVSLPMLLGMMAELDPSGRSAVASVGLQSGGMAAGPALAAGLLGWGITAVLWTGVLLFLSGLAATTGCLLAGRGQSTHVAGRPARHDTT